MMLQPSGSKVGSGRPAETFLEGRSDCGEAAIASFQCDLGDGNPLTKQAACLMKARVLALAATVEMINSRKSSERCKR
jgi:hypothetical protein